MNEVRRWVASCKFMRLNSKMCVLGVGGLPGASCKSNPPDRVDSSVCVCACSYRPTISPLFVIGRLGAGSQQNVLSLACPPPPTTAHQGGLGPSPPEPPGVMLWAAFGLERRFRKPPRVTHKDTKAAEQRSFCAAETRAAPSQASL